MLFAFHLVAQIKVAQFALKEEWFENDDRIIVRKYPWVDKVCAPGDEVPPKYINAYSKGDEKAKRVFLESSQMICFEQ